MPIIAFIICFGAGWINGIDSEKATLAKPEVIYCNNNQCFKAIQDPLATDTEYLKNRSY